MKRIVEIALTGLLCVAPCAIAQNADQNTAGPSRNQLKLRLTEPREGAQISGSTIRVAVDYNKTSFGEGQGTKFGDKNFPMAIFDVYVDNALKQTLRGGETNVAIINDIPAGNHKIVVMAKNISGEVIDRAEVNVVNMEATAATTTSNDTTASSSMGQASASDANRGASASSNSTDTTAPSSASMPSSSYNTNTSRTDTNTTSNSSMPRTASHAPEAALLGLGLVAGGLLIARRAR
ncbi:MAG: hypothetical protein ABI682_09315 [Acidobacteriota bacterium]